MLFNLNPSGQPVLQRQLDADQQRWSRALELETDAEFDSEELQAFRMRGLFGQIPGTQSTPIPTR
jgi:hypothetical protein